MPVKIHGVQLLRFYTSESLASAVQFVLASYPAAGYTIGRGDAESYEADVPFVSSTGHGTTRLSEISRCETRWLVATTGSGNTPLTSVPQLAPHYSSPSPLPFASTTPAK